MLCVLSFIGGDSLEQTILSGGDTSILTYPDNTLHRSVVRQSTRTRLTQEIRFSIRPAQIEDSNFLLLATGEQMG